jgi:AbrB family looped-hinge helix DNA binding protein
MKTTIDQAGRIVVPKAIRKAVGLSPGTPLEIRVVGSHIELEPAPLPVQLKRRGKLLVAIPQQDIPALTVEEVEATRDALSRKRGQNESEN